jgi:hypothetical protein
MIAVLADRWFHPDNLARIDPKRHDFPLRHVRNVSLEYPAIRL